jgi:hypothetical protein
VIPASGGARARELRAATLARIVVALLVVGSVAALFYAQALKREPPLLLRPGGGHDVFQPSGPGTRPPRHAHFDVRTSVDDVLDVSIVTPAHRRIAVVATALPVHKYKHVGLAWNGQTAAGTAAPPGTYLLAVGFREAGQTVIAPNFRLVLKGRSG